MRSLSQQKSFNNFAMITFSVLKSSSDLQSPFIIGNLLHINPKFQFYLDKFLVSRMGLFVILRFSHWALVVRVDSVLIVPHLVHPRFHRFPTKHWNLFSRDRVVFLHPVHVLTLTKSNLTLIESVSATL